MAENDDSLTMNEFLELQKESLEKYPWKYDDCTYSQGYVRQPLYICTDCDQAAAAAAAAAADPGKTHLPGAFCYSCSISCHTDHSIVEIGDKRNYRCLCGNPFYFSSKCLLTDKSGGSLDKRNESSLVLSSAGHNFYGRFCHCDGAEVIGSSEETSPGAVTMLQCELCEDWFHSSCIGFFDSNQESSFQSYFCRECFKSSRLLQQLKLGSPEGGKICLASCSADQEVHSAPTDFYAPSAWKDAVCRCDGCLLEMRSDPISQLFLAENPDWQPPEIEEEIDSTKLENELKAVDRKAALDGISACQSFKDKLISYLRPFASKNKVVTKEDVYAFMDQYGIQLRK